MHRLGVENKENDVADDIHHGAANMDINDDFRLKKELKTIYLKP